MRLFDSVRSFASTFYHGEQMDREMDEELRSHIQLRADDLECSGLSRAEAERQARIEFGGYQRIKEESREAYGGRFGEVLVQDVRYGLRMIAKKPAFTVVAVFTLALGIGANAVVFAVLNAFIIRPLNVPQPESLYALFHAADTDAHQSYPNYLDLRDRNHSFDGLVAYNVVQSGLDTGKEPSQVWVNETSGNYFDALRLQPYLGHFFHASDEHGPNSAPYIVLTYAFWHSHFQEDRGVVGRVAAGLKSRPFKMTS